MEDLLNRLVSKVVIGADAIETWRNAAKLVVSALPLLFLFTFKEPRVAFLICADAWLVDIIDVDILHNDILQVVIFGNTFWSVKVSRTGRLNLSSELIVVQSM